LRIVEITGTPRDLGPTRTPFVFSSSNSAVGSAFVPS